MDSSQKGIDEKLGFSPKLEKELLIRWIVDTLWRTLVHYGYWLKEVNTSMEWRSPLRWKRRLVKQVWRSN
jgi:hypothetical protein